MFPLSRTKASLYAIGVCTLFCSPNSLAADILVPSQQSTIQDAINIAQPGDVILVDAGIYSESLDLLGKAITIRGTTGAANTIVQSGSGHLVLANNINGVAQLDGLTLRDGVNTGIGNGAAIIAQQSTIELINCVLTSNSTFDGGGSTLLAVSSTITLTNSSITDNFTLRSVADVVGGAVYLIDSNLIATNSQFSGNGGQNIAGAAIGATGTGTIQLTSCTFTSNSTTVSDGGAIAIANGASLVATDTTFTSNSATVGGSAGAINVFNTGAASNLTLTNCTFTSNTSSSSGGAIASSSGGAGGTFSLTNCTFENNRSTSGSGGALVLSATTNPAGGGARIDQCTFRGNRAASAGAARFRPLTVITNSLFENNGATGATSGSFVLTGGGGALVLDTTPAGTLVQATTFRSNYTLVPTRDGGGAIRARRGIALIDNCVFEENIANGNGPGAMELEGRSTSSVPAYTITNSTFDNNQAGVGLFARGGAIGTTNRIIVTIQNSEFTNNTAEQAGHLYFETSQNVTLRDLSINGGGAVSRPDGNGGDYGGMSIGFTQSVELTRVTLSNVSGKVYGGVRINGTGPVLVDSVTIRNVAAIPLPDGNWGDYGALSINTNNTATVRNLLLEDCTAKRYGGLDITGSTVSVTDSTFRRCVAQQSPTGNWGEAGGLHTTSANVVLRGLLFDSCRARIGGGLLVSGSGNSFSLADSTFINCTAQATPTNGSGEGGGARITRTGIFSLNNLTFINNRARLGGGLWFDNGNAAMTNCLFTGNTSTAGDGGAFNVRGSANLQVINCTVADNIGGGAYFQGFINGLVVNSIFSGNTLAPNIETNGATPVNVDYSIVEGGAPGFGNIDATPIFTDPANGNYTLAANSPGIDAGENSSVPLAITTDLSGSPRFVDDAATTDSGSGEAPIVDMGAFEFSGSVCLADYNQDGGIDGTDIELFFTDWEASQPLADINLDGGIDGSDIEAFFLIWEAGGC